MVILIAEWWSGAFSVFLVGELQTVLCLGKGCRHAVPLETYAVGMWEQLLELSNIYVGVLASVLGYIAAALTQRGSDMRKRAAELELAKLNIEHSEKAAATARANDLEDARHTVLLQTYLELQEMVRTMLRNALLILAADEDYLKDPKNRGTLTRLDEELDQADYENRIAINQRIARVVDDELRQALEDLYSVCTNATHQQYTNASSIEAQVGQRRSVILGKEETVNQMLGVALRSEISRRP